MANLKQWILDAANGEEILAVVIGDRGWIDSENSGMPKGKLLTWQEAAPWLDYTFNDGFGCPNCHAVYAWTINYIVAIYQYDGSTGWYTIPRNPTAVMPEMVGG